MDFLTLILIAAGLSFDTFAVSVSTGLVVSQIRFWQAVRVALILMIFQSLMPFIGWFTGRQIQQILSDYDHWVAFGLLGLLGMKMIYESFKKEGGKSTFDPLKFTVVVWIAIATSIDAFIVGISFALININIYLAMLVIGFITFLVAMLGMLFGKKIGGRIGKRMEIIGGLILIGIGIKIVLSHGVLN